ncbi:RHS repeat-associated core domain-containing protein [Candidatus Electrothrix sp.]|uniref:RHS repeat-associated core domain-containing protein n=1 Tax=Candidatus Electrothrix sp. TaxID=2170559 RepID=UPI004055FA57
MYYVISDRLGTPQQIVDSAGTVVWKAAFQPFGETQILTETINNNIRFPGQYYDAETGLHYNWNRYYDPSTGRYLTPDPIGLDGGLNLYAYVAGNPVNWFDIEGVSKTKGITQGNDEYLQRLREAKGDRKIINDIAREVDDLKKAGKIKPQRAKKIKAWLKLAKDGRLYMGGIPIGLTTFDVWCTKYPIDCMGLTGGTCEE